MEEEKKDAGSLAANSEGFLKLIIEVAQMRDFEDQYIKENKEAQIASIEEFFE